MHYFIGHKIGDSAGQIGMLLSNNCNHSIRDCRLHYEPRENNGLPLRMRPSANSSMIILNRNPELSIVWVCVCDSEFVASSNARVNASIIRSIALLQLIQSSFVFIYIISTYLLWLLLFSNSNRTDLNRAQQAHLYSTQRFTNLCAHQRLRIKSSSVRIGPTNLCVCHCPSPIENCY